VGRTTSPKNFTSLFNDVKPRIFDKLPDDTWFYLGHGDDSTLGGERPRLDEWRAPRLVALRRSGTSRGSRAGQSA
jgi:hypothetical protein